MPVARRIDFTGPAAVFVTTTILGWRPVFTNPLFSRIAASDLCQTAQKYYGSIMAYVVMPSHVHFVVGLKDYKQLSPFMKCYKGVVSRALRSEEHVCDVPNGATRPYHLWMRRFDDLILLTEKQFAIKLNYIHENPVRAHLCNSACKWTCSSACDWLQDKPGIIPIDKDWEWLKE